MQQALVKTLNFNLRIYLPCLLGELDFYENYFVGMFCEGSEV
jgi:hypothetical protein